MTPPRCLMRMKQLCLIILIIWVSIVLGYASSEKYLFVHSPPSLHLEPGANATFTCNISALNHKPEDINWYRTNNTPEKIAQMSNNDNERLIISTNWERREAKLYIINVTFSDRGKYHCSHVNVSGGGNIIKSNTSELFVNFTSTKTNKTNSENVPEKKQESLKMPIISTSLVLALLLLLAIGSVIILFWHKRRNNVQQSQQQDLEKPQQDPSVYTVNYGVLEFRASQPYRKSPKPSVSEQVEYATIMFPPQTPCIEKTNISMS